MWNTDAVNADKNQSTSVCVRQKAGYTFSLAKALPSIAAQLLPADSSYGILHTKGALVLLAISIALAGISLLCYLYAVAILVATSTPPFNVLRVGYVASIPPAILLTISSAKITSQVENMIGDTEISTGVTVRAWMGWAFYVSTWLATGFMWVAVGSSIMAAFKIAKELQDQQRNVPVVSRHARVSKVNH
jgi:hypothetical protein